MAKIIVRNKRGQLIRMNEAALAIAELHFGVTRDTPVKHETPIEILKFREAPVVVKKIDVAPPKLDTPPVIVKAKRERTKKPKN